MAEAATWVRYSYAEYVSFERGSNVKHEYHQGEILDPRDGRWDGGAHAARRGRHPRPRRLVNPTLLVEVLIDRTDAYDPGEKFGHYRRLDFLRQYVLVSHRVPMIEVWTRGARDEWTWSVAGAGELTPLASVGAALEVDGVYAGVELETDT